MVGNNKIFFVVPINIIDKNIIIEKILNNVGCPAVFSKCLVYPLIKSATWQPQGLEMTYPIANKSRDFRSDKYQEVDQISHMVTVTAAVMNSENQFIIYANICFMNLNDIVQELLVNSRYLYNSFNIININLDVTILVKILLITLLITKT